MTDKCLKCGRTQSQIRSNAKSLGLLREFQTDVYTCCQIVAWADEQPLYSTANQHQPACTLRSWLRLGASFCQRRAAQHCVPAPAANDA